MRDAHVLRVRAVCRTVQVREGVRTVSENCGCDVWTGQADCVASPDGHSGGEAGWPSSDFANKVISGPTFKFHEDHSDSEITPTSLQPLERSSSSPHSDRTLGLGFIEGIPQTISTAIKVSATLLDDLALGIWNFFCSRRSAGALRWRVGGMRRPALTGVQIVRCIFVPPTRLTADAYSYHRLGSQRVQEACQAPMGRRRFDGPAWVRDHIRPTRPARTGHPYVRLTLRAVGSRLLTTSCECSLGPGILRPG